MPAMGVMDEFRVYGFTPLARIAHGGLIGHIDEYLADGSRNFALAFNAVDVNRRGQYLYLGSDSRFRGINIDLDVYPHGSSGPVLQWEYWDGIRWADLQTVPGFLDETAHLTKSGVVHWGILAGDDPPNWSLYSLDGRTRPLPHRLTPAASPTRSGKHPTDML